MSTSPTLNNRVGRAGLVAILLLQAFGLLVYRKVFQTGHVLFTTDDNIGVIAQRKDALPESFLGWWRDNVLLGVQEYMNLTWTNFLLLILSPENFVDLIHVLDLGLGSAFLVLFLRARGVSASAAVIGALTACWLGSTFFLTYAGHIGKFGVVFFACLSLWLLEKALQRRSVPLAILGGGALGAMFLEQTDSALFFALAIGSWLLFRCVADRCASRIGAVVSVLVPALIVAALLAIHPIWMGVAYFGASGPAAQQQENPEARWDYSTQWSWPPEETIEWVAPGYMGWRTGAPDGAYWGRLGRSSGWEQTRQGLMNLKFETFYLGAIPITFAFLGIVLAASRAAGIRGRGDLLVWGGIALVTFLLGLGKFFFLYKLFYLLPGISSIRNPVKFMQVTQLALGILAAHGMDWALRAGDPERRTRAFVVFKWTLLAFGCILFLSAFSITAGHDGRVQQLAREGFGTYANVIVGNQTSALWRGAFMTVGSWALLQFMVRIRTSKLGGAHSLAWAAVAIIMIDQLSISHRYVETARLKDVVGGNAVTEALEASSGHQRAYLMIDESARYQQLQSTASLYNHWLTYQFPYHCLPTWNTTYIRMPSDYEQFKDALARTPDRLWRLTAVGYLIGPSGFVPQLAELPALKGSLQTILTFNSVDGSATQIAATQSGEPGQHAVVRIAAPAPRFALISEWKAAADAAALAALADPAVPLFQRVLVQPEDVPSLPPCGPPGITGTVSVVHHRPGHIVLETRVDRPAILRIAERYVPQWQATIDGKAAPLLRVDYLMQGVAVPAGMHTVEVVYRPTTSTLKIQVTGLVVCMLGLFVLPFEQRFRRKA